MTGFLGNLINEFTHQGGSSNQQQQQQQQNSYGSGGYQQQQQYGGQQQHQQQQGAPQVYPPWRAVWDEQDGRWLYINDQNGERTFEHPAHQAGYGAGSNPNNYGQGYSEQYNQGAPQASYSNAPQAAPEKSNHNGLKYGAIGVAAGLAGGFLIDHEAHKVEEKWDEDKYRAEERVDRWEGDVRRDERDIGDDIRRDEYRAEDRVEGWGQDIQDAPEDAARWVGRKVQDVEDIPQDIEGGWDRMENRVEGGWDRMEDRVEDFPENVANDIGEDVGNVERFGDNLDNAYDQGRDEARDDDRW